MGTKTIYHPYREEPTNRIYNLLFANRGIQVAEGELSAIILEVALPEGLDTLAAFADQTARYINHSGKLIIWETSTTESDELIRTLFTHGKSVVSQIGPWDGERKPPPGNGMMRMTFIVGKDLYFGEGPFQALYNDPMGRPIIDTGTQLMQFLIQKTENKSR